jgi:excisionase family DNA binding protein
MSTRRRLPDEPANLDELTLYTPAEAAEMLKVKESWLRRKAGQRAIPCTFLGKHLRFSLRDLYHISQKGAQAVTNRTRAF